MQMTLITPSQDLRHSVKVGLLFLLVCYGCALSSLAHSAGTRDPTEGNVKKIRFQNSFNVQTHERQEYDTVTITFETKLSYPSEAVLKFYDRELQGLGWLPFAPPGSEAGLRQWDCFEDMTIDGTPLVHQLVAMWRNKGNTRTIFVALRYYSYNATRKGVDCGKPNGPNTEVQHVYLQIMPFVVLPPDTSPPRK